MIVLIALALITALFIGIMIWNSKSKQGGETPDPKPQVQKYKGLILFDIDGTLTTGQHNEEVVQACIDNGWAVGICTAGPVYRMGNLLSYPWMPKNLYDFMILHNNITFNNVGSGFLTGKLNIEAYKSLRVPNGIDTYGYRKGYALQQTGKAIGISNPKCLVLCDDLRTFIRGVLAYNPKLTTLCSGTDCNGQLTVPRILNIIKSCV